jgi:hypothetical protein
VSNEYNPQAAGYTAYALTMLAERGSCLSEWWCFWWNKEKATIKHGDNNQCSSKAHV